MSQNTRKSLKRKRSRNPSRLPKRKRSRNASRPPRRTRRFAANVEKARKRLDEKPLAFKKALSMELVSEALAESKLKYRERKLPPWITLWAFVWQILKGYASCVDAVIQVTKWHWQQGRTPCSPDSGHYCEARQRLSVEFLRTLLSLQYEAAMKNVPRAWKWLGKHDVKVVDGTTFLMADSRKNREAFPPQQEPSPGTRYPIVRVVGLFSLTLGLLKDFAYVLVRAREPARVTSFAGSLATSTLAT